MNVSVVEASGLPEKSFLSVRVGDTKRMRPFRIGESFKFQDGSERAGHIQLDVFEQLGSQVIHGMTSYEDMMTGEFDMNKQVVRHVNIPTRGGKEISAQLKLGYAELSAKQVAKIERDYARHALATDAKQYLDMCSAWTAVQQMLHALVKERPQDPLLYMIQFLIDLRRSQGATDFPEEMLKGMGVVPTAEAAGRAAPQEEPAPEEPPAPAEPETPADMPDLSNHHSLVAHVLRRDPSIWKALRMTSTSLGVTFESCIRPGVEVAGNAKLKSIGAWAGDEESYDAFAELFHPLVAEWHDGYVVQESYQFTDLTDHCVNARPVDPTGKYVVATRLCGMRNIRGLRFPTQCDSVERREAERLLAKALVHQMDVSFDYFPLQGSQSYRPKPDGMTDDEAKMFKTSRLLLKEPKKENEVVAGLARNWPDARGIFATESRKEIVYCNEHDHARILTLDLGGDIQGCFRRYAEIVNQIERSLYGDGHAFAFHLNLGYLSSCPTNLGTSLRISVMMNLPHLVSLPAFSSMCASLGLQAVGNTKTGAFVCPVEVHNATCIGISEVQLVNQVMDGCSKLIDLERRLAKSS